ncbi:MAG: hypothetical protein ABUL60_06200 [Myxococcales bacterium]
MSHARLAPLKLTLCCALLALALPSACATEVKPDFEDTGDTGQPTDSAGTSAGGTPATSAGTGTVLPHAGTTATGGTGVSNPFGGTSSSAGTAHGGTASAGTASGGTASGGVPHGGTSAGGTSTGGSAAGGKGGAGGAGGTGSGGTGTGGCACPTKKTWVDNTSISFVTGDCFDVASAVYLYTGTKAQTWANKDCNPAMQLAWCSDMGADYKFMLCK